ncbi:ATP-binding cassette domain-containing protein [Paenibacillus solisilvae]|uniref:ATP-binding cassette domain-containing protein n=1 Tax=Paenibacillus solisilvae TaxID=2486751 RepID=A0ABW0W1N8_9BACL
MEPLLHFERISKTIKGNPDRQLFGRIEANVIRSDKIAVIGPSGQGKSTLLRILSLLDQYDEGEMYLQGRKVMEWQPKAWRQKVCYVAQQPFMLEGSVEDNLRIVSKLSGAEYDSQTAEAFLAKLGLAELDLSKNAASLSGGEKQRISLIRSLLLRPEILLLDEITASLDNHHKHAVEHVLANWQLEENRACIWITHDMEQASRFANQMWLMEEGRLTIHMDVPAFFSNRPLKSAPEE